MAHEQELNKKLARWAGFTNIPCMLALDKCEGGDWLEPDGKGICFGTGSLPKFYESLDACFLWLMPRLQYVIINPMIIKFGLGIHKAIDFSINFSFDCAITYTDKLAWKEKTLCTGHAETPALALCRAIEQFIDGKERKIIK